MSRCSFKDGADACLRPAQFRKATGEQACERHALLVNWVRVRVEIEPNIEPIEGVPCVLANGCQTREMCTEARRCAAVPRRER